MKNFFVNQLAIRLVICASILSLIQKAYICMHMRSRNVLELNFVSRSVYKLQLNDKLMHMRSILYQRVVWKIDSMTGRESTWIYENWHLRGSLVGWVSTSVFKLETDHE